MTAVGIGEQCPSSSDMIVADHRRLDPAAELVFELNYEPGKADDVPRWRMPGSACLIQSALICRQ